MAMEDYIAMKSYVDFYNAAVAEISGLYSPQHPHRRWEYGQSIKHAHEYRPTCILDVGGCGSPLAYCLARLGCQVTVTDLRDYSQLLARQDRDIAFVKGDFLEVDFATYDSISCISVLEHVPDDIQFVHKLASLVRTGGYLLVTVDYHPSGLRLHDDHLRTYNLIG